MIATLATILINLARYDCEVTIKRGVIQGYIMDGGTQN